MKKFLLIASVAAIAVTAPAQAERGGRKGEQQNSQAEAQTKAQPSRGGGRAERAQTQQARPQRAERAVQPQVRQQPQARAQRVERQAPRMVARQQPVERRARQIETRQAKPQLEQRARVQEARRVEQARSRAVAQERVDARRVQRTRTVDNQERANRQRTAVAERQAARLSDRNVKRQEQLDHRTRVQSAQTDRPGRFQRQAVDRQSVQQAEAQRNAQVEQMTARRRAFSGDDSQWRQREWQQRAERQRGLAELRDRRFARWSQNNDDRRIRNDFFRVGQRVDSNWWYDDYVPLRYRSSFYDSDRYYYRYDGDYLYRLNRSDNVVMSLFPILGGAYSVGQPLPFYTNSSYNVPYGYNSLYYDTPDSYYRYGDGAIYGVNPTTQLITGIVALLTGQNLGIGQQLPLGYDVYNVPYAYRSSYYDTPDMMYRYDDGYIYGVDPRSRMIETSYPVYGGYYVGNQWPSYAGYDYDVPDYYDDLYYDAPGYDYRYASGGIYQVDPKTQLIAALAALVTGQNFNVGQQLPLGYDTYNVPFAYRDQYYDTNDNWYRYADGRIVQVDPNTRLIRQVIMV